MSHRKHPIALLLPAVLIFMSTASAQAPCPADTGPLLASAWSAYRADSIPVAAERFGAVLDGCPMELDARIGLGFARLRQNDVQRASELFGAVVSADSSYVDGWEGLARVAVRRGVLADAVQAWKQVLALDPSRTDARDALDALSPDWERPVKPIVRTRAPTLDLTMRVRGEGFEVRRNDAWEPFYVKGVNMGLAMPGKFPAEFTRDSTMYAGWFADIAAMNANAVRIYTILPPEFYRALRDFNLANPATALYVVHGVWTELPPGDDFDDPTFNKEYLSEIQHVVDVLHGAADIAPRPGHASGRYDADVSPWTIAYIMGREWEPYSVILYNEMVGGDKSYEGRFLTIRDATPTDVWMVKQCDLLLQYEMDVYNAQRPIAYTNWPTTDPIVHATETSYDQEMAFRGLVYDRDPSAGPPHEEEGVSLNPSLAQTTEAMVAGWFASYHVYPYYPDFMLYDPEYNQASSSFGRSNYFGYLRDLKREHAGIPLVISEFGIPTSRATAHLQPQGWNHGGVDENDAADMVARLAAEIHESGAAGAVIFAWIDEWFKRNWFSADFELPAERGRLWHNILSPEQHYGMIALRPGAEGTIRALGGDPQRWLSMPVLQSSLLNGRDSTALRVGSDEGYLYLALETPALRGKPFPWDSVQLQIGIDTHDRDAGQHVLPLSGIRSGAGFEFLIELHSEADAELRVLPEYNPYLPYRLAAGGAFFGEHFRRPIRSEPRLDGVFDSIWALTNRPRYIAEGTLIQGQGVDLGRLKYGTHASSSLSDWWYDQASGTVQLRLPWLLINVSDPSSRSVMTESAPERSDTPGGELLRSRLVGLPTNGFVFGVVGLAPGPRLLGTIPDLDPYGNWPVALFRPWLWEGWEIPTFHQYKKASYRAMQRLWSGR